MFVSDYFVVTLKLLLQQRYGENAGQLLDSNETSLLKAAASGQSPGYLLNL
jgi:hypothetical protein